MLPEHIVNILNTYGDNISEEVSSINLAITRISDALNTVNSILINEMSAYAKNTGIQNIQKEKDLWNDSLSLREYISSIKPIIKGYQKNDTNNKEASHTLDIFSVLVLSNTRHCASKNHDQMDVMAHIPTIKDDGFVLYYNILASFCKQCKRYTILKSDFKEIEGVVICEIIDQTNQYNNETMDDFEIEQHESILYKYGYNVQSKANLSSQQRHIILASIIEANILNRRQIIDHLSTLIERGSKILKWKEATTKWKEDRHYVQYYKTENLPSVIFDKIILKYSCQSE